MLDYATTGKRASTSCMSFKHLATTNRNSLKRCTTRRQSKELSSLASIPRGAFWWRGRRCGTCLLTWNLRTLPLLSSHWRVSCGRRTRCSALVEILTSRRQRSSSSVGKLLPGVALGVSLERLRPMRARDECPWRTLRRQRRVWGSGAVGRACLKETNSACGQAHPSSTARTMGSMNGGWTRPSVSCSCSALGLRLLRMHVRSSQCKPVKSAPHVALSSCSVCRSVSALEASTGWPIMWPSANSKTGSIWSRVGKVRSACRASKGSSAPRRRVMDIEVTRQYTRPSPRARAPAYTQPHTALNGGGAGPDGACKEKEGIEISILRDKT